MPNKITYTIKTPDGKEHQVSKENIDKHGIQAYADAYEGATIRMRDSKKGDYDIPLANYNDAKAQGLHAFSWEHKPVVAQNNPQATQKQLVPKVNTAPGTPMTAAQKAQVLNNVSGIVAQSQSDLSRTMRKFDYAKQNTGLDVKPIKLGENRKIATEKNKNGQTTYLDAEGNRFDDHAQANFSQTQIEEDEAKRKDLLGYIDKKAMNSVNSAYDKQYSELEDFKKKHPYLSAFSRALSAFSGRMSGGGTANINQYRPEEARTGLAALALNQKTRQAIDEGKRYEQGDTGFWGRATRGLKKGLTSASTYDLGLSETDIAGSLKEAADRYAKGQATQMDELLLDAAALNSETGAKYSDALGGWFGAGEGIPGVASFMMQIGSNPMSGFGKATAQSVAKTVTKRAVQKFGTGLAAKAAITLAKGATRVAADAVEAGVVTAMYSPTKIVGDYLNRKTGTVVHDGNGGYTFEGKEYSDIKAVAKAINDQNAENLSEMWGDYLPGMGKVGKLIGKGARKIGLGKVVNAFEQMSSSQWMKTWNEFMDRTKWNGLSGEYMEEAEKNLYNALTNGDMTLDTNPNTGVFSRKINEDTFKSVALMSGIMSGISTMGYTHFKYKASRGQKKADNNAKAVLGAEKWSEIKKLIDNADDKSIGGIIEQIGNDNSLNTKQKMAILDYQYKSAVAHGANIQDLKNKLEGNYDEKANRYDAGYNATEDELANIKNELELRHRQLAETFKDDPSALQQIEEDPKAFLQGLKESEVGGEKAKVINAYEETRAAYDGMIQRVKDNIDDAITENNTVIEQRTHQDGNIYPATMKLDDRKVYVVGGNVQMNEDGTGIDHEKSSSSVMVRDAETGKVEMVDPSAILSVDTPVNAEEEKATSSEQIKQTYAQEQANKIDGVLEFKAGDTYSILDEDQKQHTIQIIGEAIDEKTKQPNPDMVMASIDGLEPTMLPKEQIQAMNDEENLWRLEQSLKQGEEVENTTPHSAQSYNLNDEITLINEDGKPVRGSITTDQNEDGKFEVYTEEPINGKRVNLFTAEELDAMTGKQQEQTNQAPVQEEQGEQTESPALVSDVNDGTIAENATVQKEETPQHEPTALESIPTNEQGEPIYEQADPETAWDAILEQTEGDESIAQSVADGMVADMEAAVKRAEKAKVKGGTTIAEKIAAEKERVANIEQAKATLEHWKKIASTNSRRQEAIQAEESRKAEEAALLRKEQEEEERAMREEEEHAVESEPKPISKGIFGNIYNQFKGKAKEAVDFLMKKKDGEAIGALHHKDIGDIDLVWGKEGTAKSDGFGLAKLAKYHPEVLSNLQEVLDDMIVTKRTDNRVQLESAKYQAAVRLTWDEKKKTWLLTMFEKKNSALSNTTDTDKTHEGKRNDTATPQDTAFSASKVSESSNAMQGNVEKSSENETTRVETNPTEAQKEAGNYKKGHIKVDGMNITIEQPKGSIRRGKDASGKEWESEIHNTYGYIRGTEGVDGDHIDIFLSDNPNEGNVFVVDQVNKDGSFDEHKVMYGFADKESARQAYLSNYEDGWQGLGNITEVSKEEFKKWIDSSKRKTKPFAEYKGIIKSNKSVSSPVVMSEDEYLASKGLNGNMTDYMLDKLRIPHSETARQQKQREKEAARVRADFDNQKEEARKEYRQKIAKGELREPTKQEAKEREIAKLIKTANGHEDNPSVQAARRLLAKRGVDWRTNRGDTSDNDWLKAKEDGRSNEQDSTNSSNVVHSFGNSASQNDTIIKLSDTSFAKMENGEQKAEREIGWLVDHNIRLEENSRKLDEIAHLLFDGDNIDSNRESTLREEAKKILEENEKLSRDYQKNYSDKYFGTDDITANYILQEANERLIALGVKPVKESYYFQSRKNEVAQNAVVQLLKRIGIPVHFISRVGAEASGQGNSRGWTNGLDIWLTKDNINAETPVHEYTHIWTFALMKKNPKLWAEIKNLLKDSEWVDKIQSMDAYKYTLDNEDLLYSEVLSRISGERNGEKFESMAFKLIEEVNSVEKKVDLIRGLEKLRDALKRFWEWVGVNLFGMKEFKSVDDVCDRVLFDLLNASDIARTEEMREYYEEESEMNAIIDKAKEDGTYLKTPNGEDSKLPEKVWAYARTKKFKTQLSDRLNLILDESKEDFKDWEKEEFRNLFKKHGLLEENNEPGRFLASQFMYSEKYYDRKGKMQEEAQETMNSGKGGKNVSSVKSVDMTDEGHDSVALQVKQPIEQSKNLVALHNLSEEKLQQALELGGFPMPSIAITKANIGHTEFGNISLLFGKDSINPTDKRNKVYGGDAWTPTFPSIGYKLNSEKTSDIYRRANNVGSLPLFRPVFFHPDNYENKIDGQGSNGLVEHFKDDYGAKQMFLYEKGNAVEKFVQHEVEKYSDENVKFFKKILETIGLERLKNEGYDSLENEMKKLLGQYYDIDFDTMKPFRVINRINSTIQKTIDYAENGNNKIENDIAATEEKIDERIDPKEFRKWLEKLFAGVVEKKGIRNEQDMFTPSGNRREWEKLYDAVTLDNAIKAMQTQAKKGGTGLFGGSIFGAASKELKEIEDIRNEAKLRINPISEEDYQAEKDRITERLKKVTIPSVSKSFSDAMDFVENVQDAVSKSHTAKGIYRHLHSLYPDMTMEVAKEIEDIVKDIQKISTRYLEAKPYRAVSFDEIKAAVVPSDTSSELIQQLKDRGIEVSTYEKDNQEQRKQIVNEVASKEELLFRNDEELEEANQRFNEELENLTEENADKITLWLGNPSDVLLSSGIENKPLKLYGNKVIKKMKKHGFALDELRDLPKAVADPIAVFDNYQREGNRTILTELRSQEKNIMVAVTLGKNGVDVDFNTVSSVFGKGSSNVVDWISKGYLAYVDKEKALNYLHFSERNISEAADNSRLSSAANIVKSFENPTNSSEKVLDRKTAQAEEVAEKERQQMVERANELAETLHLDNVEIVTDASTLEGKKAKAKGFYSTSTGKITIVIPNHSNIADVEKTLLHEAVAHHGLRKLFGEHFDNFLDNVFKNASEDVRREIVKLAAKNKWDFRIATEEYLASLAEDTNFEKMPNGFWDKIKRLFTEMLRSIGLLKQKDGELNDNELLYILWRSYKNLKEKGQSNSILNKAEDIAMQHRLKVGNYSESTDKEVRFRDGEPQSKERVSAAERYEQRVSRSMFQSQEALQDSMLGLKEAMDAIIKSEGKKMEIENIEGFENAYLGENRLSSVNKAEADAFAHLVFKPMLDEVAKLAKNDKERSELTDYMMAKHGLERNEVMRKNALEEIINNEKLSDAQKDARASVAEHRDYAGLTALTDANSVEEAESEARRMVEEYEQKHDTTNLWDKVNTVTKGILSKSYECGMMNKQTYEKVRDMYQFYIPLRGFDEETSRDAYAYLSHGQSAFNAPIKTAKGRSSKADDPFANMQSMAESAIMQGNRNVLVKQKFLNFALNHPSDLVSVSTLWLKYDDVTEEWRPVFPDNIEETDTADEVEKKMQDFEQRMAELVKQDPERYKHGKDTENIPYRIVESRDLRQHQVVVKRNGRDYVLTINGNPRAAQALNGLTNPDNDVSGAIGAILNFGEKINRQLSAFYTTRNPDFVISNFIRDMLYANSIVWVKERPNYALRFHRNIGRCNPAQMKILLSKHKKGELDMNNSLEHMFHQFIMNGGETGYANVRDIEQHKNDIQRELKRANGKIGIKRSLSLLGEKLDEYNRAVENCARFAAFLTSREMGRTIDRSIYDAKDISVNFNKKGSGAKFMKATGQTKIGKTSAFISGIGRSGYVFWNAAIQGTTNFGRQFKRHPAKAFTASATMFILGALIAGMGMGDDGDDDKNSYWNLPESVRRSNILFRVGEQWVSIPLPVEYRSIYGMGELMVSAMSGKEHFTNSELGKAIAGQVTQILPIDFLEGEGGVKAFVPSAVKPFAEVISNKGWTGMPIYKDTPYNKNMPEWTKTYKSANKYLVGLAKILNEKTGGDAYTKGSVNINPAQIEYLLNGYFGGVSNTIDKLTKSAETIAGKRDYDPKSFLLLNRVLKSGDERTEERAINREYYRLKEEYEILRDRLKNYENDTDNGVFDFSEKINFLYNSPEYARYEIFEDYREDIEGLYKELKDAMSDEERAEIEVELTGLKKQMIEEMNTTRK